jgi:hypothetical protein
MTSSTPRLDAFLQDPDKVQNHGVWLQIVGELVEQSSPKTLLEKAVAAGLDLSGAGHPDSSGLLAITLGFSNWRHPNDVANHDRLAKTALAILDCGGVVGKEPALAWVRERLIALMVATPDTERMAFRIFEQLNRTGGLGDAEAALLAKDALERGRLTVATLLFQAGYRIDPKVSRVMMQALCNAICIQYLGALFPDDTRAVLEQSEQALIALRKAGLDLGLIDENHLHSDGLDSPLPEVQKLADIVQPFFVPGGEVHELFSRHRADALKIRMEENLPGPSVPPGRVPSRI